MAKNHLLRSLKDSISKQFSGLTSSPSTKSGGDGNNNGKEPPVICGFGSVNPGSSRNRRQNSDIMIGLDIGTSKVIAVAGKYNGQNKIEVLGAGEAVSGGVTRGVISNITKTTTAVATAFAIASKESNAEIKRVSAGISGPLKTLKQRGVLLRDNPDNDINLSDMEKLGSEMYKAIVSPGEEMIYMQPCYYQIDNSAYVRNPVGMSGVRLEAEFQIITGYVTAIKNVRKCISNTGMDLERLYPVPLASAESVLNEDEKEKGVMLIDIGASTTSIAIYKNGIIQATEVFRLGGNSITEDIKCLLGLPSKKAELLKTEFGNACDTAIPSKELITIRAIQNQKTREVSRRELARVICARIEELIGLPYYAVLTTLPDIKLPFGIVITGGTSLIPNVTSVAENITGMECNIGIPDECFVPNPALPEEKYKKLFSPSFSTALGLLKLGLRDSC